MSTPLQYCSMPLVRHTDLCRDHDWLNRQLASDTARVVTLWSQKNMVRMVEDRPQPVLLPIAEAALILGNAAEVIYLGHDDQGPVFAADLAELEEKQAVRILAHAAPATEMINLRQIGTLLDPQTGSLFAYARGLAWWHQQNPFCSRCGSPTYSKQGGHARACKQCDKEYFPRIDPAVIMLIEQSDPADGVGRCLLGRGVKWQTPMYSTLAGYVDAGESLEQAVMRETLEEAGLHIDHQPAYIASQPWPFPSSMMVGFRASTSDTEICIDRRELTDAQWFSRDELHAVLAQDPANPSMLLPPKDSIARLLIDQWLAEQDE